MKWGAKELLRVSQPSSSQEYDRVGIVVRSNGHGQERRPLLRRDAPWMLGDRGDGGFMGTWRPNEMYPLVFKHSWLENGPMDHRNQ